MITTEIEELAGRLSGLSEGELLRDEELQGLDSEGYTELLTFLGGRWYADDSHWTTPRLRAVEVACLMDEDRRIRSLRSRDGYEDQNRIFGEIRDALVGIREALERR
jgi:hypothetical protein